MKKYILLLATVVSSSWIIAAPATTKLENNIKRAVAMTQLEKKNQHASNSSLVPIVVQFRLSKSIMFWAPDTASKSCQGVLIEGAQIAVPSVCFKKYGYGLDSFRYVLNNEYQITADSKNLLIKKDISFIPLDSESEITKELVYMPVRYNVDWREIYTPFETFLKEHQVRKVTFPRNRRHLRARTKAVVFGHQSTLQIGDALIHEGHVVALVKRRINWYEGGLPFTILVFFTK